VNAGEQIETAALRDMGPTPASPEPVTIPDRVAARIGSELAAEAARRGALSGTRPYRT
jgi:hypothetical protein